MVADDMLPYRLAGISRDYASRGLFHAAGAAAVAVKSEPRDAQGRWITGQAPRVGTQVQITHGPHKHRSGTIIGNQGPPHVVVQEHGTGHKFTVHERHYRVTR